MKDSLQEPFMVLQEGGHLKPVLKKFYIEPFKVPTERWAEERFKILRRTFFLGVYEQKNVVFLNLRKK